MGLWGLWKVGELMKEGPESGWPGNLGKGWLTILCHQKQLWFRRSPQEKNPQAIPHFWDLNCYKRKSPLAMEVWAHGSIWQTAFNIAMVTSIKHLEVHRVTLKTLFFLPSCIFRCYLLCCKSSHSVKCLKKFIHFQGPSQTPPLWGPHDPPSWAGFLHPLWAY